jgi:hypothetical protein
LYLPGRITILYRYLTGRPSRTMEDTEEGKPFLSEEHTAQNGVKHTQSLKGQLLDWTWVIFTVIFASLSVFLYFRPTSSGTYEHGFSTDLGITTVNASSHQPDANIKS